MVSSAAEKRDSAVSAVHDVKVLLMTAEERLQFENTPIGERQIQEIEFVERVTTSKM